MTLLGFLLTVTWAVTRDLWTTWTFGGPECPRPPDSATRRQRIVWRLLHSIDPILPPFPIQIDDPDRPDRVE